ncbi:MAG: ribonuclease H-like domain-containing protein, partial [Nitrospirota bacterium]|nr:ribonuclease H-like domain-containing protein [Nitrospirota bacterium]
VRLWNEWRRGRAASLERLLRYNAADVRNLEPLAERFYDRLVARCRTGGVSRA